jgi:hypothetical protein
MSAAKCETGWGDLSTRALFEAERPSPHPAREFHSRSTLPLQGRVRGTAAYEATSHGLVPLSSDSIFKHP